ncbi:MAG TPA: efflux RND transporter periplasmic adaptor subunit [Steroidobacteraceae bacterium]|nr:efflux RND transporter periplasmic adaptor subunit [Steroidobacteraceae bacterium]
MAAHPEHPQPDSPSVTYIGRDRLPHPTGPAEPTSTAEPVRPNLQRWIFGGFVALLVIIALLVARHFLQPTPLAAGRLQDTQLPLVSVMTPRLKAVQSTVTFTGTIHARYDMPISPEGESGRITGVFVEVGDHVKRGQLLVRLDQSVLLPQIKRLEASLEEARAQANLSAAEYRRAQGVEAAGALSAEEIARRRAAAVTDEARVKVAAAQLNEAKARLGKTEIVAPADGIVLTRNAEVGQTASPGGEPLFRLARDGEMEMRGQVAERDLAALSVNQSAQVYLTGIDEPFAGKVRLLGAIIDPQTRLGEIRIALAPDTKIRPGAFARAEVIVGAAQRPILPQTAVLSDSQGTYVLILDEQNRTVRRAVRIADTIPEGLVIGAGLNGDERVVSTAGAFLRVGEKVRVADTKQAAAT